MRTCRSTSTPSRTTSSCSASLDAISDKHVLALIKMWLKTPVEETDGTGRKRLTGGKGGRCGTPQGGVISPLLANIYMNRFLKYWRANDLGRRLPAHVVTYADDLVILTRGHAR